LGRAQVAHATQIREIAKKDLFWSIIISIAANAFLVVPVMFVVNTETQRHANTQSACVKSANENVFASVYKNNAFWILLG